MKRLLFYLLFLGCLVPTIFAQAEFKFDDETLEKVKPSIIAWTWDEGVYHSKGQEPHTVYLLLNTGGAVEIKLSKNFNDLIKSWISNHPDAEAIVISTIIGVRSRLGWTFKPVWVVDRDESLNIFLVRKGACRANTMALSADRESYLSPEQITLIHKRLYEAETLAFKEKLGIWADAEFK